MKITFLHTFATLLLFNASTPILAIKFTFSQMGILIGDILPNLHKNFQEALNDEESKEKLKFDAGELGEMGKVGEKLGEELLKKLSGILIFFRKKAENLDFEGDKIDLLYNGLAVVGKALAERCMLEYEKNRGELLKWFGGFRIRYPELTKAVNHSHLFIQVTQFCIDKSKYFNKILDSAIKNIKKQLGKEMSIEKKEKFDNEVAGLIKKFNLIPNKENCEFTDFDKDEFEMDHNIQIEVNLYHIKGPFRGLIKHPAVMIDETEIHYGYSGVQLTKERALFNGLYSKTIKLDRSITTSFAKIQTRLDKMAEERFKHNRHDDLDRNCVQFARELIKGMAIDTAKKIEEIQGKNKSLSFTDRINSFVKKLSFREKDIYTQSEEIVKIKKENEEIEEEKPSKLALKKEKLGQNSSSISKSKKIKLPKELKQPPIVKLLKATPVTKIGYKVVQKIIDPHP